MQLVVEKSRGFIRSLFKKSSTVSSTSGASADIDDEAESVPDPSPRKKDEKTMKVKKTNSNAVVVHLSSLSQEPVRSMSDPWYCRKCGVAVSSLSKLTKVGETTTWIW